MLSISRLTLILTLNLAPTLTADQPFTAPSTSVIKNIEDCCYVSEDFLEQLVYALTRLRGDLSALHLTSELFGEDVVTHETCEHLLRVCSFLVDLRGQDVRGQERRGYERT